MFNKKISLLLIFSIFMSVICINPIYAEKTEITIEDMAKELMDYGVLTGYSDGSFKLEQDITRAEVVTLMIKIMGLEKMSDSRKEANRFKDVNGKHWAAGYINLANEAGILNGYPDGTFKADENVSFAESMMLIVNLLGYSDEINKNDKWPISPYRVAYTEHIFKGSVSDLNSNASRGEVIKMLYNSLELDIKENGKKQIGTNILNSKLKVKIVENTVTETNAISNSLQKNEIKIDGEIVTLPEKFKNENLLGVKIKAYLKNGELIRFEKLSGNSKDFYDRVSRKMDTKILLKNQNEYFKYSEDITVKKNGKEGKLKDLKTGDYGNFIIDDNDEIIYADVINFNEESFLVKEIDKENETIRYYDTSNVAYRLRLNKYKNVSIFKNHKISSISEINENDLIYLNAEGLDNLIVYVFDNKIEGELEKVNSDRSIIVENEKYRVSTNSTFSLNENEEVDIYDSPYDIRNLVEKDIIVVLDLDGKVRHIFSDLVNTSNKTRGVVLDKTIKSSTKYVTIYNLNEKSVEVYEYDSDTNHYYNNGISYNSLRTVDDNSNFDYVEFTYSAHILDTISRLDSIDTTYNVVDMNSNREKISLSDGSDYYIDKDTVILDVSDKDVDKVSVVNSKDLLESKDPSSISVKLSKKEKNDDYLQVLFIVNGLKNVIKDEMQGLVIDKEVNGGDYEVTLLLFEGEEVKTFETNSSTYHSATVGKPISINVGITGKVVSVSYLPLTSDKIEDSNKNFIDLQYKNKTYILDDEVKIFDFSDVNEINLSQTQILNKMIDIEDLNDNERVKVYIEVDGDIEIIKLIIID